MKKEISIKNVLIALCLIACSLICAYMGVEAFKKSMYLKLGLNAVPHIICELWVTPNGESERKIFSNVQGREEIHPDWHLDTDTSTLKYTPNVDVDLGYLFTMRVVNYTTTSNVFVEVNGTGASYNSIVLAPCSNPASPDSDSVLISAVSNDYRINFSQVYSVVPTFTQVSFDMSYANNTLLKKNNNYYITKGENLNAKLITPTEACPDVYNLTINSTDKMSKINDGTFYNTLNQTLSINASEINGNIALNSSIYWDGSKATQFASGDGTAGTPYQIATPKQLALLANITNTANGATGTTYSGTNYVIAYCRSANYEMLYDIYLNDDTFSYNSSTGNVEVTDGVNFGTIGTGYGGTTIRTGIDNSYIQSLNEWSVIGSSSSRAFSGNFDGKLNEIYNMFIGSSSEMRGLFGNVVAGTVRNIGVDNSFICALWSAPIVGFLGVSTLNNGGNIFNCYSKNAIVVQTTNQTSEAGRVAGICGNARLNSNIVNCYSSNATLIAAYGVRAAGIAGLGMANIVNCYSLNPITLSTGTNGSIIGLHWKYESNIPTLAYCYSDVATMVGKADSGTVINGLGTFTSPTSTLTNYTGNTVAMTATYQGYTLPQALNTWLTATNTIDTTKDNRTYYGLGSVSWQTSGSINGGYPYLAIA